MKCSKIYQIKGLFIQILNVWGKCVWYKLNLYQSKFIWSDSIKFNILNFTFVLTKYISSLFIWLTYLYDLESVQRRIQKGAQKGGKQKGCNKRLFHWTYGWQKKVTEGEKNESKQESNEGDSNRRTMQIRKENSWTKTAAGSKMS